MVAENFGIEYKRALIKTVNFGLSYGMGLKGLIHKTGLPRDQASTLRNSVLSILSGINDINEDVRNRMLSDRPLRTWGGREYYCRPPIFDEDTGRMRTLDYQMINVLIQGGAGDVTKEAWIAVADNAPKDFKTYLTVHDEFLASCPKGKVKPYMKYLRDCMESVKLDVPMLSEGKISKTNWAECTQYDVKGGGGR